MIGTVIYVDPKQVGSQAGHDILWAERFNGLAGFSDRGEPVRVELQYEIPLKLGYWDTLPHLLGNKNIEVDLHAPTQARDIASPVEEYRHYSIQEYKRSFDQAASLGSRLYILHLTPHDIAWSNGFAQDEREKQLERAWRAFEELVAYKEEKGYPFYIALENLEYPKWPSDLAESRRVMERARQIHPEVVFCVDIPHLWHSRAWLRPDSNRELDFACELRDYLHALQALSPIVRIHFAGAYIWQVHGREVHETHGIPGLAPWDKLEQFMLHLDRKPHGFAGVWMEIDPVLRVVAEFAKGKPPLLLLEMHEDDLQKTEIISKMIELRLRTIGDEQQLE
jgi:sugar phosphate isomerase/epimerase